MYFEYCEVNEWRVNVDKIKDKHFEDVRTFKLGFCSVGFEYCQFVNEFHTQLIWKFISNSKNV